MLFILQKKGKYTVREIANYYRKLLCLGLHKARPAFAAGNRRTGNQRGENCRKAKEPEGTALRAISISLLSGLHSSKSSIFYYVSVILGNSLENVHSRFPPGCS